MSKQLVSRDQLQRDELFVRTELDKIMGQKESTAIARIKDLTTEQNSFTLTELKQIYAEMKRDRKDSLESDGHENLTPEQISEEYLYTNKLFGRLRNYRNEFYVHTRTHYERLSRSDIKSNVTTFMQNHGGVSNVTARKINDVLMNLEARTHIPSTVNVPIWLREHAVSATEFVAMENGILNVKRLLAGDTSVLQAHTSEFFSTSVLPYKFDPNAACPIWNKFIKESLPDETVRLTLQEWFGYNLVYDVTQERFVILTGEGANGKTVVCTVLRELVGVFNCSAVTLEAFDPRRTFPLAATAGKLANIVAEMGEIDKMAEGVLKQFVSGETITVERKHCDPFPLSPTVRLTFATNILPRFTDRSEGLWRRLLLFHFGNVVAEGARDTRLIDGKWWRESGELSGIFNWAMEGLRRLRARGHFVEPDHCKEGKAAMKHDSNPARIFLDENCTGAKDGVVSSRELYRAYARITKDGGYNPLGEQLFAKEVKRHFPTAELTKNAHRQPDGSRSRMWTGVRLLLEEIG